MPTYTYTYTLQKNCHSGSLVLSCDLIECLKQIDINSAVLKLSYTAFQ